MDDPFAQLNLQLGTGQLPQKGAWRQQTMLGVLPAQQRLGTHHIAGFQVNLGLVEQHQLARAQGLRQPRVLLALHLHLFVLQHVKQVVAVAPGLFGQVHGLVGMAQQGVSIAIVSRENRHAHAGRDGG